ncbi:MAG: MBL fold metallo-hydrolase [Treponemataceae bacterium]|nr:MAG: MBL fold metallo-hydrolase [Treponemataceae bacterium]
MLIRFFGTRGSIPAPLSAQQIRAKIDSVVQRITSRDIESLDARARFIASLPDWLYGTVGGNTTCVRITSADGTHIILDAGSGIRDIPLAAPFPKDKTYHIMFSHFHWDHLQGLPFFTPAYSNQYRLIFHSASSKLRAILENQMTAPYFPVPLPDAFTRNIEYNTFTQGVPFSVGGMTIVTKKMRHPGDSYAYKFTENGTAFIFATDTELSRTDFEQTKINMDFFEGADTLVLDTQYTTKEAIEKENWGHSSFCYAVDFAAAWKIKILYLFHHDPAYDDKKLYSILKAARWYSRNVSRKNVEVNLAQEGMTFEL